MKTGHNALLAGLLAATALAAPGTALAGTASRASTLEARLEKLEEEMASLRAELAEARATNAQANARADAANTRADAAVAQSENALQKVAAIENRPVPAPQPDGFRSGATTIKLGGYLKLVASNTRFSNGSVATNTLGRDFYLPQTIPTTMGGRGFSSQDFTAKQTRLWLNLDTQVSGHTIQGYLETDFQTTASAAQSVAAGGSQRTTNGYTLALRRAYMQVGRFTFGQDWSTFQYAAALPESTDYVGGAEGTVFVRQPLIRYTAPLSRHLTLNLGIENPESALVTAGATATLESGTDRMPDFTARIVYSRKRGEISLAGLLRQVRGESTDSALVNNVTSAGAVGTGLTATGLGGSIAGKLFLNGSKSSDIRFMATYGQGIGRYVGLNFAPDAVYNPATNSLTNVNTFAALVAARLSITRRMRVNIMGSYQDDRYDKALTLSQISGLNKKAWSAAANLFYSPVKNIDLGLEYRHGERTVANSAAASGEATGQLDRVEFAAKYSF
ncbi:Porin subfamily protein [Novosphingobium sp. CF614]|uniref:DcaP family trimeric outer membrane transporter n=1 Tax=Novosphingobium sp. CF614 TaxID=1884364 RepID=UPI0008EC3690|nr:DcaP family trimeric outer membrane transporter [Novosphingobium sp. CF614]SFG50096.1 Porin subfamily protein [Novosphingobium sp. CF614]